MLPMAPMQTAATMPLEIGIALIAAYGATLTAYIGIAAFFYWRLGQMPSRQEHVDLRNEFKSDIAELRSEVKAEIAQLREDMKADNALLREEFRRSHQQIMLALINHSHRDDGQTVFTMPPELEMMPAPADD